MQKATANPIWNQLHVLVVLSSQGSFTATAVRLGTSKAHVSQTISNLESRLGLSLVRRTTRSVNLTEAGQKLVEMTSSHFDSIERSFHEVRDQVPEERGLVRVSAPVAFARQQLVPRISRFLAKYPQVRIELDLSDRLVSMVSEGFDVAIRHVAQPPETHIAWKLCETKTLLVASPTYLATHGALEHPLDLQQHGCVHYPRSGQTPTWVFEPRTGRRKDVMQLVSVSGPASANNSEALRDLALSGVGIAMLPDFSAQQGLLAGQLQRVLPKWEPIGGFAGSLFVIRPHGQHASRAVRAFIAFSRAEFASGFPCG